MRRLSDMGNFAADAIAEGTVAFISWHPDGRLITVNSPFLRLTGLTAGAADMMKWPDDFCPPETAMHIKQAMSDLDRNADVYDHDGMLVRKDGSIVLALLSVHKYSPGGGEEPFYYSFITDLSGYRPAAMAIDYYEEKARQSLDMTFSPVWINRGGKLVYANQPCADLLGAKNPGVLIGKSIFDIIHPDYHEVVRGRIKIMLEEGRGVPVIEEKLIRQDGDVILAQVTALKVLFERKPAILVILRDITETHETEAAIRESREILRMIMDNVPQRIFWKDIHSVYQGCNKYFAIAAGVGTPDQIVGKTDYDLAWTREQADAFRLDDREVMNRDRPKYHIIEPQRQADGSLSWLDTNKVPLHDSLGKVIGILGTYEDITDRRKLQEELKESQASLLKAQQVARMGSWEADLRTGELRWSDESFRIMGFKPRAVKPDMHLFLSLVHPADRERIASDLRLMTEEGGFSSVDYRIIRPDGSVRYLHNEGEATFDETGKPLKLFGISQDITERKLAEEFLRLSEEKLKLAIDGSRMGMWDWDIVSDKLTCSDRCREIFGVGPDVEISYEKFLNSIYPGDRAMIDDAVKAALRHGTGYDVEMRILWQDRTIHWVACKGRGTYDATGKAVRMTGIALDITDRKRAEIDLRKREADLSYSQKLAHIGSWRWNPDTGRDEWSAEFYRILGLQPGAVEPNYDLYISLVHPDDRELVVADARQALAANRPSSLDYRIVRPDGSLRYVHVEAIRMISDREGRPVGSFGTIQDITERKQVELSLEDAKTQAEMYLDLMGHDIGNMDQVAMGFLELALETIGPDSPAREYILRPLEALENSADLIQRVKKLQQTKEGDMALHDLDVGQVLSGVLSMYSHIPGRVVTIHTTIDCNCKVKANDLLRDVFENLIGNTIKHSTGPLDIRVSAESTLIDDRVYCQVSIEDNGPGIPDGMKNEIFARFSKGAKKSSGRGLGLYLVKSLVDLYQGKVWVEDRVPGDYSQGVKFVVRLPVIS